MTFPCRNVLIYLEPVLQGKVISVFHYALRPSGFLVLGTSEGLGATTGLFAAEDRTNKIFSKKAGGTRQEATFSLNSEAETETATRRTAKLEDELAATKEYLQSVIETQEATNEELQSANEEILSSNEELQS